MCCLGSPGWHERFWLAWVAWGVLACHLHPLLYQEVRFPRNLSPARGHEMDWERAVSGAVQCSLHASGTLLRSAWTLTWLYFLRNALRV